MVNGRQTICLSMIVKNEAPVIRRCLDSLAGFIDAWVIVDTGSTDGTQQIIREHLAHLPGELVERPWVDFGHNRTEALELARGRADYVFIIDADEVLVREPGWTTPVFDKHAYHFVIESGAVSYFKTQLVDNRLPWCFRNVLHEYIYSPDARSEAVLGGVKTLRFPHGARARDPLTYRRDALTLERALLDDPANARNVFYLAQSYRDAQEPDLAIRWYRRRAEMGGWDEEVWYSLYQIAEIRQQKGDAWPEVLQAYLDAYQARPTRAGPLYKIGMHYQRLQQYAISRLYFSQAIQIAYPLQDRLFIEKPMYDYMLPLEYAVASYYCGDDVAAVETNNRVLLNRELPADVLLQVERNRAFSLDRLRPPLRRGAPSSNEVRQHVLVVVPFRDPGPWLDDCVESLLEQTHANFTAVFVDDGSRDDYESKRPDDDRFVWIRHRRRTGMAPAVRDAIRAHAQPSTLVLVVDGRDSLADADTLAAIVRSLAERESDALYGQHRFSSGRMGVAVPIARRDVFARLAAVRPPIEPIVFRASLAAAAPATGDDWAAIGFHALTAAGFDRAHFNDRASIVVNLEARAHGADMSPPPVAAMQSSMAEARTTAGAV
jgi:glycosyltransferase involved in cell wall biosynthesis